MSTEKRDYSAAKVEQIETFLNNYYGELEGSWFKGLFAQVRSFLGGIFSALFVRSYHGDYESYMKSLTAAREEAERKIRELWSAVETVETHYESAFQDAAQMTQEYTNMAERLKNILNVSAFTAPIDFDAVLPVYTGEYIHSLEYRAWEILKHGMPYSDQELEVLAYAYTGTTDDSLRERILNCFYKKESQKANGHEALDSCYFFERDEEQWKKFEAVVDVYTTERYRAYLQTDPDDPNFEQIDKQINEVLRNNNQMHALDGRDTLCMNIPGHDPKKSYSPIKIEEGKLKYDTPDFQAIEEESRDRTYSTATNPHYDKSYSSWTDSHADGETNWIGNGAEGAHQINSDSSKKILDLDPPYSIDDTVTDLIKKGAKKGADALVPGSGKVIGYVEKIYKIGGQVDDIVNYNRTTTEYDKPYYSSYVDMFDMKCVSTSGGYTVYPSPSTAHKVKLFYDWLETQKTTAPSIYNAYQVNACVNDPYGVGDQTSYFLSKDGPGLMKDLSDANLLNSWESYLESHT